MFSNYNLPSIPSFFLFQLLLNHRKGDPGSLEPDKVAFDELLSQTKNNNITAKGDNNPNNIEMTVDVKFLKSEDNSENKSFHKMLEKDEKINLSEEVRPPDLFQPLGDWKRVCGVDQIRRVVEHLGENLLDQELRNNLVTSLLADRKVVDTSGQREILWCIDAK